jgi:hypothetical protein
MNRRIVLVMAAAVLAAVPITVNAASAPAPVPFNRAQLRVEINSTDGDAGLQIDLDHDPWRSIRLVAPDGRVLVDVTNRSVLRGYGLTELFSESSEPPFTTFPLSEFKKLFPAGEYVLEGREIDGTPMRSTVNLTHDFPAGPEITAPEEDATVGRNNLVIRWRAVTEPAGIDIVRYQVLVVDERDPVHTLSLFLPASARSIAIPHEFLTPGDYKTEVLAIEKSGNQTLTEVAFSVG